MGAVPHNMWRTSGGMDGPTGLSPATGSLDPPFPPTTCCDPLMGPCDEELRRRCCWCAPEGALAAAFLHPCTYRRHAFPPQPDSFATSRRSSPGCAALLLPDRDADCRRCTPEGTPALRSACLRRAACCPCTTLVGMSPPVLRACRAACCLRCSFQEANCAPAWRWRVARASLLDACHHSQPPEHRFKEADTLVSHVLSLRSYSQRRIQPLQ